VCIRGVENALDSSVVTVQVPCDAVECVAADYINEDAIAAPKVGRGTSTGVADNVVNLEQRKSYPA
jgi:hypothetical protein